MSEAIDPLPAAVVAALRRSDSPRAVTLLHELTGIGLEEAEALIEERLRRTGKARGSIGSMLGLPFAVSAALRQGDEAEAIRLMQDQGGLDPEAAQTAVESMKSKNEAGDERAGAGSDWGRAIWLTAFLAAVAFLGYYFFTRR